MWMHQLISSIRLICRIADDFQVVPLLLLPYMIRTRANRAYGIEMKQIYAPIFP